MKSCQKKTKPTEKLTVTRVCFESYNWLLSKQSKLKGLRIFIKSLERLCVFAWRKEEQALFELQSSRRTNESGIGGVNVRFTWTVLEETGSEK